VERYSVCFNDRISSLHIHNSGSVRWRWSRCGRSSIEVTDSSFNGTTRGQGLALEPANRSFTHIDIIFANVTFVRTTFMDSRYGACIVRGISSITIQNVLFADNVALTGMPFVWNCFPSHCEAPMDVLNTTGASLSLIYISHVHLSGVTWRNNSGDGSVLLLSDVTQLTMDAATCTLECPQNEVAVMIDMKVPLGFPNDTIYSCPVGSRNFLLLRFVSSHCEYHLMSTTGRG
jgi:hypothetical protein